MLLRIIILAVFAAIVFSLGSGLYYLLKDDGQSGRTLNALKWRIGLSIALFVMIMLGIATGVIEPHGIHLAPPDSSTATNSR